MSLGYHTFLPPGVPRPSGAWQSGYLLLDALCHAVLESSYNCQPGAEGRFEDELAPLPSRGRKTNKFTQKELLLCSSRQILQNLSLHAGYSQTRVPGNFK